MPKTLAELKKKYELAEYEPDPDCPAGCRGEGEVWQPAGEIFEAGYVPCMCIFTHPDDRAAVAEAFASVIADLKSSGGKQ